MMSKSKSSNSMPINSAIPTSVNANDGGVLPFAMVDVEKSYGEAKVLDGVNFALQPGSITGLLGRNASGKTTLIRTAVGLLKPEAGDSLLFGTSAWNSPSEIRQRVGYVSQRFNDLSFLKVSTAIELIGSFYDCWDGVMVERFRREWDVPLSSKIGKLSYGQQQKVSILLGIGHRPELLILDEPVASLDPVARHDFLRALLMLNDEINQTILFSSHITTDIERVAADVAIVKPTDSNEIVGPRFAYSGMLATGETVNLVSPGAREVGGREQFNNENWRRIHLSQIILK